jgi:hypothetical protein
MADSKVGDEIGPWRLIEEIGTGGNATIWRAKDENGLEVALKVLRNVRADREPYKRFRREIDTLRRLAGRPGILPIVDSSLPDDPSKANPPWIAMPLAVSLSDSLADASLRELVDAFAVLAATLADLHKEGISHRDIKPSNLYWHGGGPAVGDFGLVQLPEPSGLTDPDRPLGARNFIPYELIADPVNADGRPADVFMLVKSLWTLATNNRWPPQGEQRADNLSISISGFQTHPRARVLDGLIERATRHAPSDRPTMEDVAKELRAWVELPESGPEADLDEGLDRLLRAAASGLAAAGRRAQQERALFDHAARVAAAIAPIEARLAQTFPLTVGNGYDEMAESVLHHQTFLGSAGLVEEDIRATRLDEPNDFPRSLIVGRSLALTDDGMLHLGGIAFMGYMQETGSEDLWTFKPRPVAIESIEATAEVDRLIREIIDQFPQWVGAFADLIAD